MDNRSEELLKEYSKRAGERVKETMPSVRHLCVRRPIVRWPSNLTSAHRLLRTVWPNVMSICRNERQQFCFMSLCATGLLVMSTKCRGQCCCCDHCHNSVSSVAVPGITLNKLILQLLIRWIRCTQSPLACERPHSRCSLFLLASAVIRRLSLTFLLFFALM